MIKIFKDSRDLDFYRKAGQATTLPTDLFFDTNVPDIVQTAGDVRCTCITICDVATDITGVLYDIDELFRRVKHDENGANPTDAIKEAKENGLKRLDNGQYEKPFISYWKAHTGNFDAFDNVRSALQIAQRGICIWTPWYDNWSGTTRIPKGNNVVNFHMYEIEGVKEVNGELVLIIEAWLGRKMEVDRFTFNWIMALFFSSTAVLSTMEIDVKRKKGYIQSLIDGILNFINTLRVQLAIQQNMETQKPVEQIPQKKDLLTEFCLAIQDFEGKPGDLNYKNNNPGNIKGRDGKFMKFKTYEEGFAYLKEYVKRAARGAHRAYRIGGTIQDFFNVYAPSSDSNHPEIYARYVAKRIGVDTSFKIIQLL